MRGFYRWMRKGMTGFLILLVVGGIAYYLAVTLSGIKEEMDRRATLRERDETLRQTATFIAPTLQAQAEVLAVPPSQAEASPVTAESTTSEAEVTTEPATEVAMAVASNTPTPPLMPSATLTEAPPTNTEIPPSETTSPSPTPSDTPSPTASETATATETDSPSPTLPSDTPTEVAQLVTLLPTNTPPATAVPTNTPRPSRTPSDTPSPTETPTETLIPTNTPRPSHTPTSSNTPTPAATDTPSITPTTFDPDAPTPYPFEGTYATPVTTPIISLPPRAPLAEEDPNIVNIVILGSDARGENIGRTDVIIITSINKTLGTVSMWHVPRDLLVYIPGNTVDRMNRAYPIGRESEYPGGGIGMVKETILYNFGIPIDYYALVNFSDFEEIIDQLGGLQISVDCQIEDWALITPDSDPTLEESYERYTMHIGRQTLDPYYALWYARSRKGTGDDFDRGRRQIDILRAIFYQAREQGLISQLTEIYPQMVEIVNTDMGLTDMLEFLPMANSLDLSRIERFNGVLGVHYDNFTTPDDGRFVLLPRYDALYKLVQDFVTPATGSRVDRATTTIEIYDASAYGIGFDLVAADRLGWEGFLVFPGGQTSGSFRDETIIYDYTGDTKGSALERIMEIMRVGESSVIFEPDPNRTVDYRIEVGRGYNTCVLGSSADEIDEGPPVESETDADVGAETVG